jgi:hypothetical protein
VKSVKTQFKMKNCRGPSKGSGRALRRWFDKLTTACSLRQDQGIQDKPFGRDFMCSREKGDFGAMKNWIYVGIYYNDWDCGFGS